MSSVSSVSQQAAESLFQDMSCPIGLGLFKNPVVLNCEHSIEREYAEQLYGKMRGLQVEKKGRCPLCNTEVMSYVGVIALRNIAQGVQNNAEALALVQKNIADEPLPELPFPGTSAKMVHKERWHVAKDLQNVSVVRQLVLESAVINSFVKQITIFGCLNNTISVLIESPRSKCLQQFPLGIWQRSTRRTIG